MAKMRRGHAIGKSLAAVVLALVTYVGLQYGAMLRDLDRAASAYSQGDLEGALRLYDGVESRLRTHAAMRLIPSADRQTLFLNQARLLYSLKRYDDAVDRLGREEAISGVATDGRFFLLRGNITYRRARAKWDDAPKVDLQTMNLAANVFQDAVSACEDSFQQSLEINPNDWDAKYNLEFMHSLRRTLGGSALDKTKMLEKDVAPTTALPPELVG